MLIIPSSWGSQRAVTYKPSILATYQAISRYLTKLPMVIDWMKRSAFCHGAAMMFAMALSHYPEDFELHLVADGYCSGFGSFTIERVNELSAKAAPYADGVLAVGDLLPHLGSQVAPGRLVPKPRDFPMEQPFRAAVAGRLTPFMVNEWRVADVPLTIGKEDAQVEVPAEEVGTEAAQGMQQ
jgi:hypothetical protein